jgi:uncharacterized protein
MEDYGEILARAGCGHRVIGHCRTVARIALGYAEKNPDTDRGLVLAGAKLHDIGRSRTHSIRHAQCGADIVHSLCFSDRVARIVECHTGAGLSADECTLLGLIPKDCMPMTTEEKIVCHADNLAAGKNEVGIEHSLMSSFYLPRKIRKRIYRLANEVELLCN